MAPNDKSPQYLDQKSGGSSEARAENKADVAKSEVTPAEGTKTAAGESSPASAVQTQPPAVERGEPAAAQPKGDAASDENKNDLKKKRLMKFLKIGAAVLIAGLLGYYLWGYLNDDSPGEGFAGGNGRLEATEIDISTKLAGRIEEIKVDEGDFVEAGQVLAQMQTSVLEAQLAEAKAQYQQALTQEVNARSQVTLRESDKKAAEATVAQRESELDAIQRRLDRTTVLTKQGAVAVQTFDDQETSMHGARAAVASAEAQVAVAQSSIDAAKASLEGAKASIKAAQATIERIEADIKDSTLLAPRAGRIQYRIAQPGEVLAAGGKVLNLVDLNDVYMTFFLPATETGLLSYGSEARIVLDAAPDFPVPATITYVASTAQFTPKTVETPSEREKLMFRIKAQIDPKLLNQHITYVKTGLPGMVWVRLDPSKEWPDSLKPKNINAQN